MAAQRKNLLEAFKNAGDLPEPKPPVPQPRSRSAPPAGKAQPKSDTPSLFDTLKKKRAAAKAARADAPPRPSRKSAASDDGSRASRIQMPTLSLFSGDIPPALLLAAGAGVLLAVGVAIGRASAPEVEAADGTQEGSIAELMGDIEDGGSGAGSAGIVPAGEARARNMGTRGTRDTLDAGGRTKIEDSPLFDSANHYTIVVQTYTHSNSDHAWATFEHLRSEGFSVFPPVVKDEFLLILVGAAPSSKDLAVVQERIRKLQRDGDYAYHDAYRVPIDNYIER